MVSTPLAPVDVRVGKKFVELLRRSEQVDLLAAAWLYTESKDDWRLYLVSRLVDTRGAIYASLTIFDLMFQHADLEVLQRRVEIVGRRDRHAEWLHMMKPVGNARSLGDIQLTAGAPENGIWSAYIYLST